MRDAFVTEVWADIVFMQATLPGTPIPLRVLSLMKDQADNDAVTVLGQGQHESNAAMDLLSVWVRRQLPPRREK